MRVVNLILGTAILFVPFLLLGLAIGHWGGFESKDWAIVLTSVSIGIISLSIGDNMFRPLSSIGIILAILGGGFY